jgi:hypothetical protein
MTLDLTPVGSLYSWASILQAYEQFVLVDDHPARRNLARQLMATEPDGIDTENTPAAQPEFAVITSIVDREQAKLREAKTDDLLRDDPQLDVFEEFWTVTLRKALDKRIGSTPKTLGNLRTIVASAQQLVLPAGEFVRGNVARRPRSDPDARVVSGPAGPVDDGDGRLWMRAQTDPEIGLGRVWSVFVTLGHESLDFPRIAGRVAAQFTAEPDRKLTIEVLPVANLEVIGSDRAYVDLPEPGKPVRLRFTIRAMHAGEGRLWVMASQGQVQLQKLELTPTVLGSPVYDKGEIVLRPPSDAVHMLRIIEQRLGDTVRYRFDIEARDLGVLDTFTSDAVTGDRDAYVRGLFARIERFWVDTNGDAEQFQAELRAFGVDLLTELVPRELQEILWRHRAALGNIMVLSTEPFIPWELVHLTDPAAPNSVPAETAFLGQLGLVRWRSGSWPPERLVVRRDRSRGDRARLPRRIPASPVRRRGCEPSHRIRGPGGRAASRAGAGAASKR